VGHLDGVDTGGVEGGRDGTDLLESVEDETGRLRWIVGVDQVEWMHMRHETSEAEYIDRSWRTFGPAR
jgi:hypothetical protein